MLERKFTLPQGIGVLTISLLFLPMSCAKKSNDSADSATSEDSSLVAPVEEITDENLEGEIVIISDLGGVEVISKRDQPDLPEALAQLMQTEEDVLEELDEEELDEEEPVELSKAEQKAIKKAEKREKNLLKKVKVSAQSAEDYLNELDTDEQESLAEVVEKKFGTTDLNEIILIDKIDFANGTKKQVVFYDLPGFNKQEIQDQIDGDEISLKVLTYLDGSGYVKMKVKKKHLIATDGGVLFNLRVKGLYKLSQKNT